MSRWTRSDVLSLAGLIVGVIGLLVVVLQILPSVLPEVAVVTQHAYSQAKGLATSTTTFRNVSYDTPINNLEAEWTVDPNDVAVVVDSPLIGYSLSHSGQRRVFKTTKPIPAQMEFHTIFNSARPFIVSAFSAKANQLIVGPAGHVIAEVPIIEQSQYDKLLFRRYAGAALIFLGYAAAYTFLIVITKKLLLSDQAETEDRNG